MKLIGVTLIFSSCLILGVLASTRIRNQIEICDELNFFLSQLSLQVQYRRLPINDFIKSLNKSKELKHIKTLDESMLKATKELNFPFSREENLMISEMFYSLGKYDCNNQINQIEGFIEYVSELKRKYEAIFTSKSKVYLCLGGSVGIVLSILLI